MEQAEPIPGFYAPVHRALTEPILLGGAPRAVAILNGTLAAAVGLGLRLWIVGCAIWLIGHLAAVWAAKRDPAFVDVVRRHLRYPNTKFDRPEPLAPFLLVEVAAGSGMPIELGGRTWQDEAQVYVHVLVPTNTGTDDAATIEDQVRALFRQPSTSGVIYESVDGDPGGPGTIDGAYWRTTIIANCRVQTILGN